MFMPVHGQHSSVLFHNGRAYSHIPSRTKKLSGDDKVLLKLHPTQAGPFFSNARFRVVVAGRRWGKTHWTCIELLKAARAGDNKLVWYVAPTYTMAKQIAWEKLKEIIPIDWIAMNGSNLAINETTLSIKLINGSRIILKGADRPDTLRGVGINFLVLDEYQDFKIGTWELVLRATLTDTRGRAIFIGTPKSFNQLYEMYQRGQRDHRGFKNPQWESWQFKTSDSPFIALTEIDDARKELDSKSFKQEYEASFESMQGRVHYDFDRRINVRRCPYDPSVPILIGQDFNVDPMSSVLLQRHGDEIWQIGELSLRSSSTEDVCNKLLRNYGWKLPELATIYPDPSGNNRSSARGESDVQIFREWGFKRILFRKKAPAVRDRIASVNRFICDAKGTRRYYVDPTCKTTIQSLEQLQYKEMSNEVDKTSGWDHMTDALGYPIEFEHPVRKVFKAVGHSH